MTRRLCATAWFFAASLAGATIAHSQAQNSVQNPVSSIDTSQPIVIKSSKPAAPKTAKLLGEFVSSTPSSVTVRERANTYHLHTFTYAPQIRTQMSQIAARGGYRYGDKVEIDYTAGSDVALRIKGRPSGKSSKSK